LKDARLALVCLLAGTAADEEDEEEDASVLELLVSSAMSNSGRESSVLSSLEEVLRFRRFGLLTASAVVDPVLRGDESAQAHVLLDPADEDIGWKMENADVVGTTVHSSPPLDQDARAVATNSEPSLDSNEFPIIFGWIGCRLCRRRLSGWTAKK
jgi:hypothetical protein